MSQEIKNPDRIKQGKKTESHQNLVCWIKPGERLLPGMICPRCHQTKLEYNGLLNLVCPKCGLTEAGAST